jgi:ribosomal 30S subunit maturation factor RimM
MKRFLSTTAILFTLSGGAYADGHATGFGNVMVQEGDFFASDLIGMRIYNSEAELDAGAMVVDGAEKEWDDIGEINDVIISQDGKVTAVILGVGGFLGLGERDVSVSMDAIKVVKEEGDSDDRFLVVTTSKEMLEVAPEFDRDMGEEMEEAAENAEAKAEEAVVAADTAMEREMMVRPAYKRDGYQDVEWTEMTADDLEGARLYGTNDEDVGEIETLIVNDSGKITDVLADIGGFLGMGEHTVRLSFEELQLMRNADGSEVRIYVDSTEEKLEALPEYEG